MTKRTFFVALLLSVLTAVSAYAQYAEKYKYVFPEPIEDPTPVQGKMIGKKKFGYYNLLKDTGEFQLILGYQFDTADAFDRQWGLARVSAGGAYGFIKLDGAVAVPLVYDDAKGFNEHGRALVALRGKWGIVDHQGNQLIPCAYDSMNDLFNGWYEVSRNGEWGYLHYSGLYASSYSEYEKARNGLKEIEQK